MKKRLSIFFLLLTLVTSVCYPAYAAEKSVPIIIKKDVKNEYDTIKQLSSKNATELKEKNYSDDQIKKIKDYKNEFNKKYSKLNDYDDQFLKLSGYTEEQIKTIRNYTGTEDQMYALSATLTTILTTIDTYKSSSYSYVIVDYDWNWSTEPVYEITDMVAFAWSQGFATEQDPNETYAVCL